MDEVLRTLLAYGVVGYLAFLVFWLVAHPDTAQKWAELFYAVAAKLRRQWDRRAVQHGLQYRVDRFVSKLASETGRPKPPPVKVAWTDSSEEQRHFFDDNRLVLRMHEHERQDRNLVTGSLLVVSELMAKRAKRFLSSTQARSTDLYAVEKLLGESPPAQELFVEEVMGPEVDSNPRMRELIEAFQAMDRGNLFFPVYVRELNHLGSKVVVPPRDERLITDVDRLIEFLVQFSTRVVGDLNDRELIGNTLKCALLIVATHSRAERGQVEPLREQADDLARRGIETLYLIGSTQPVNLDFLERVASSCCSRGLWREVERRRYRSTINVHRGEAIEEARVESQMVVLRRSSLEDADDDEIPPMLISGQ